MSQCSDAAFGFNPGPCGPAPWTGECCSEENEEKFCDPDAPGWAPALGEAARCWLSSDRTFCWAHGREVVKRG